MNAKLLFKTLFLMIVLVLLVLMGMSNTDLVKFNLPPILNKPLQAKAAIMFISFFAVGLLTGTILTAGVGGRSGGSGASKPSKGSK